LRSREAVSHEFISSPPCIILDLAWRKVDLRIRDFFCPKPEVLTSIEDEMGGICERF